MARCNLELWPAGLRCNQPAGHEGAHMWARPGSALNPNGATA